LKYDVPAMPFDAVLVASRVMTAKEAKTSDQAKHLLVNTGAVISSFLFLLLFSSFL
jgi:enoyl reductase-like protein